MTKTTPCGGSPCTARLLRTQNGGVHVQSVHTYELYLNLEIALRNLKMRIVVICERYLLIVYVYFNIQGSTESTWYEWNFGDGSKRKNITGLSNAENISHTFFHHGTYNVSVAAGNTAGQDNGTTEVIVLGKT